jgi:sigma54-dependent transcription regulator
MEAGQMYSWSACRRAAHHVLLLGPPEAGKSMLARRLTTILPAMSLAEALETTRIHRVAGLTGDRAALVTDGRDRGSFCSSIARRTGNGSYDFAIRGESHIKTISRASSIPMIS